MRIHWEIEAPPFGIGRVAIQPRKRSLKRYMGDPGAFLDGPEDGRK